MALEIYHPGLDGVIAGETNISSTDGEFLYRGYAIHDLADGACFLEVAHLLLFEELPTQEELADFRSVLVEEAELPDVIERLLADLPLHVPLIDVLRTGVSLLGHLDPQVQDSAGESGLAQSMRILARLPLLVAAWMRVRDREATLPVCPSMGYAGNLLRVLQGQDPSENEEQGLEVALILSSEHGFDTSTFAARVAASTRTDVYAAITAALGAMGGPENSRGFGDILQVLSAVRSPGDAPRWVAQRLRKGLPLPGFESVSGAGPDPRCSLLERTCSELAESCGQVEREDVADAIERAMWEETRRPPQFNWPLARLFDYLGLESDLHLPVFLCGRLAGWCAHILEQIECEEVFRPRARYRGVDRRPFEPLFIRG